MNKEELWELLSEDSRRVETSMDSLHRKRTGSYYTDLELTDVMMHELVTELLKRKKPIEENLFLEPCVGAGNFVFSYLKEVDNLGLGKEKINILLNNIFVADINRDALRTYTRNLKSLVSLYWGIDLDDKYFSSHLYSGLLVDVSAEQLDYIPLEKVVPESIARKKFDVVVTNPPYKNLKAEKNQYSSEDEYDQDKEKYNSIAKIVNENFKYAKDGVLNLYKLFVEEIIDKYANDDALVSLLIPSSLLSDKTCERLRTYILKDNNLISVRVIKEGSGYIDAQQALITVLVKKGSITDTVRIYKNYCDEADDFADVKLEDIINPNNGNSIIALDREEYIQYKKLIKFPVVKELDFIVNMRGELDLTAGKKYITKEKNDFPLLRGRNIGYYSLIDSGEADYVLDEFVLNSSKKQYIEKERIICQQIANMHKERRVTYSFVGANHILGNSCNFITVNDNIFGLDIYAVLGLFNSKVINWYFKLTSSNNHINNYEIDCFPVPVNSPVLNEISDAVKQYLGNGDESLLEKIENLVRQAYELD